MITLKKIIYFVVRVKKRIYRIFITSLAFRLKKRFYLILPSIQLRDRYLTLIQRCLIGTIYEDKPLPVLGSNSYDRNLREHGCDWPSYAHSMIGVKRMENVRYLSELVIYKRIPGDFIETGVWRGGACIMMRAVLEAYGIKDRRVLVADSFAGLPPPDEKNYPEDKGQIFHTYKELSVSLEEVKNNFSKYDLLNKQVVFIKGWFKDTLSTAPIKKLAILRLDGDLYESTFQALEALYDKVSVGGFVIIDDYHVVAACKKAVHDFCISQNFTPAIQEIDGVGVFWKKAN
jgi:hypothetical protein